MLKLFKSKRGFTLVELMIVVVIMAILVAVAVPIYNSVTSKARIKTCAANQREIQGQLNSVLMSAGIPLLAGDKLYIKTNASGESGEWRAVLNGDHKKPNEAGNYTNDEIAEKVAGLFQKTPYCPQKSAVIMVEINAGSGIGDAENVGLQIITSCSRKDHSVGVAGLTQTADVTFGGVPA